MQLSLKLTRKDGSTVRAEFAYYVSRTFNRTVPAYRTLVQFLKRLYRTYVVCFFFAVRTFNQSG